MTGATSDNLEVAMLRESTFSSHDYSRSLYVIVRPSICRLSSVTFVRPTQTIEIFSNVSTPFGTLAIPEPR